MVGSCNSLFLWCCHILLNSNNHSKISVWGSCAISISLYPVIIVSCSPHYLRLLILACLPNVWRLLPHNIRRQGSCQVDSTRGGKDTVMASMMAHGKWPECVRIFPPFPQQALLQRKYSASSDVWSYGIVMFEIWSLGCKPFEETTAVEVSMQ